MTRAHAKLAPSAAERWSRCPGSIRMSAGLSQYESEWAAEGTAAHQIAERALTAKEDAATYIGVELKVGAFTFVVDEEMADAVQVYLDFARSLPADAEIEYEQRLDMTMLHPEMFGTGDLVAYVPSEKHLIVADYKHGRGVAVEPQENPQALSYAVGAAMRMHNRGVAKVTIVIVQPRCPHPSGSVREWTTDPAFLIDWSAELAERAKATEAPDAPLAAGDWCKFCPAAGICPALRDRAFEAAKVDFANDGTVLVRDLAKYDAAELALALENAALIETWVKRVREFAHHEAEAGRVVPGWKLVAKRAMRRWISESDARDMLSVAYGLDGEAVETRKFMSPAQIEAAVGKKAFRSLGHLVEKKSSGAVLAPESDPRPPVTAEAARDFEGVPV